MKKVVVRKAVQEDMPSVLELIRALALFEKEPDAVILSVDDLVRDGFTNPPKFECLVAEKANSIIGMALYYPRYSTWKGATYHLEDLIVTPDARGTGVGSALYRAFIAQAYEKGVRRIEWVVLDWNVNAVNFYKQSGAEVLEDWQTVQMSQKAMQDYLKRKNEDI